MRWIIFLCGLACGCSYEARVASTSPNRWLLSEVTGVVVQENVEGKAFTTEYALLVARPGKEFSVKDPETHIRFHLVLGDGDLEVDMNTASHGNQQITLRGFSGTRNFKRYFLVLEKKN